MQAPGSPNSASAIASTTRVLPDPVGPRKRRFPTGRRGGFQSGQEHLIDFGDGLDSEILPYDFALESGFKLLRVVAASCGIQNGVQSGFHHKCPQFSPLGWISSIAP